MLKVCEFLAQWECQDTIYVKQDRRRSLTYIELNQLAADNARNLVQWGARGENIALIASNSTDWIVAYWSLLFAGATVIPLSPKCTEDELLPLIRFCNGGWVICDQKSKGIAGKLSQKLGIGRLSIRDGNLNTVCAPKQLNQRPKTSTVPVLCVTSGSTAKPKAVMLSDENLIANTSSHIQSLRLSVADVVLIVLPVHYSYAHTAQFLTHTRLGGTIVLYDQPIFSPRLFCQLIETHRITITSLVPTLIRILNNYRYLEDHDLSSLRYLCCGGAPIESDAARSLMAKLPQTKLVHTYGLTEASPRVTILTPENNFAKLPSIGKPMPGVEVRVVRGNGQPAECWQVGELQVRGKNVMVGYYGLPEETRAVISDGWLSTGDLARIDHDGHIYLVGRKKNIIINDGVNVSPEEVESVLLKHPAIRDAVIKGEPADSGELIAAHISLTTGSALSLEQLHSFMRGKLAEWKWPRKLYLRTPIRRTETGKIRRADA